jgi:hypothetical protein
VAKPTGKLRKRVRQYLKKSHKARGANYTWKPKKTIGKHYRKSDNPTIYVGALWFK